MATRKPSPKRRPAAGSTSAGDRGVAAASLERAVVTTGDRNHVTIQQLQGAPPRSSAALREAYLHHVLSAAGLLPLDGVDFRAADREAHEVKLHEVHRGRRRVELHTRRQPGAGTIARP
jgi:hypothetical protein